MAKTSRQSGLNLAEKHHSEPVPHDEEDLFDDGEFGALNDGQEKEVKQRDARRKIEIYWEKKQLRDLFDDFDDSEVDF